MTKEFEQLAEERAGRPYNEEYMPINHNRVESIIKKLTDGNIVKAQANIILGCLLADKLITPAEVYIALYILLTKGMLNPMQLKKILSSLSSFSTQAGIHAFAD